LEAGAATVITCAVTAGVAEALCGEVVELPQPASIATTAVRDSESVERVSGMSVGRGGGVRPGDTRARLKPTVFISTATARSLSAGVRFQRCPTFRLCPRREHLKKCAAQPRAAGAAQLLNQVEER
jgi:hypothetical protein